MTDCTRCGDCCEHIQTATREVLQDILTLEPGTDNARTARFALTHWTQTGTVTTPAGVRGVWSCSRFDPATRQCTAHDERPPICSGFPWYGLGPDRGARLPARCAYNADVRTTLPIVAVNGKAVA